MTIRAGDNLKALLKRVNRATSGHGKKTELAKFLGVPPQRVTNWLSLHRAPNGEITILLQQWVNAQEKNKNAPGRVTSTAGSKTRSAHPSSYERHDQKAGPRKN